MRCQAFIPKWRHSQVVTCLSVKLFVSVGHWYLEVKVEMVRWHSASSIAEKKTYEPQNLAYCQLIGAASKD